MQSIYVLLATHAWDRDWRALASGLCGATRIDDVAAIIRTWGRGLRDELVKFVLSDGAALEGQGAKSTGGRELEGLTPEAEEPEAVRVTLASRSQIVRMTNRSQGGVR